MTEDWRRFERTSSLELDETIVVNAINFLSALKKFEILHCFSEGKNIMNESGSRLNV